MFVKKHFKFELIFLRYVIINNIMIAAFMLSLVSFLEFIWNKKKELNMSHAVLNNL